MTKLPKVLIFSRLFIGAILLFLSLFHNDHYKIFAIILISVGLLTDIFDSIIARRLNISTESLRRLDSTVDQAFWILIGISTYIECPGFFHAHYTQLIILFTTEALTYIISYIKYKREVATHAIASKVWTLIMFATLIQIISTCNSGTLFQLFFYTGMITRIEIITIIFLLKKWTNDVPSVYHAVLLRQGKSIKRNKLFNG
ncbi:MAG: CDP-alcohol phosphatidyltransferase [Ferruginibacter sp.]|nr:CDP-alcohol phosphatidyltransferase [Ferruginibacter sp.]